MTGYDKNEKFPKLKLEVCEREPTVHEFREISTAQNSNLHVSKKEIKEEEKKVCISS